MSKAAKPAEPKKPHGRPSKYTPELADEICERLESSETLRSICADDRMPSERTVDRWVEEDVDGFSSRYMRARAKWIDAIAHRARETARGSGDSAGDIARDKLIIDTDLRLLACWDRARYGTQRTEVDLTAHLPDVAKATTQLDEILGLLASK